ncbi:olfactory receptor 52B6-like [Lethenteron reissneri]|uniref:olfactory receptor 52B6-like n=1 Tax=Lethenteron reissneri TaxID=7753 RepID=UPI002AB75DBA|nr:olfactory receptor 52B6-like [Lethenteron reissneri]
MVPPVFDSEGARCLAVAVLAAAFLISFAGNGLIGLAVASERRLHRPMFIFVAAIAASDVVSSAASLPRVIANALGLNRIAFGEAMSQMFFVHFATRVQSFVLSAMSLDRCLAVVRPLRYRAIASNARALAAVAAATLLALAFGLVNIYLLLAMDACAPLVNPSLVCDALSVLHMLCGDVTHAVRYSYTMLAVAVVLPAGFICLMYALILNECCKRDGYRKALRTCGSHLLVVSVYYTSILFSFVKGFIGVESLPVGIKMFFQLAHFILPPALNPIIYGLCTAKIRRAIAGMFRSKVHPGNGVVGRRDS